LVGVVVIWGASKHHLSICRGESGQKLWQSPGGQFCGPAWGRY
jgi:hypothetical protein